MSERSATILHVQQSKLESTVNSTEVDLEQDMNQKANDLDKLVELMKGKLKVSNKRKNTNFNPDTRILVLSKKQQKNSKFLRPQLERIEYKDRRRAF